MPNRILKESICSSEDLAQLDWAAEVFWYRLIVQCDDYGRMDARPAILRARCYPLALTRVSDQDIATWLRAFQDAGMIQLYAIEGKPFLRITSWERHQQVRAKRSKYPDMQASDSTCYQMPAYVPENSNPNPNRESESESTAAPVAPAAPPPPLPPPAQVYLDHGGTFPAGKLADGTTKKARAIAYISEYVASDPAALALWGRVVAGYCAQWSSKSYTVMVQDYFLAGRVPGEPKPRANGHGPPQESNADIAIRMLREEQAHGQL